jgi:hypothetical protein
MLYIGLAISGLGVVLYILSAVLLNHYLRKNRPDVLEHSKPKKGSSSKGQKGNKKKEIKIIVTENATPGWVALLGVPAMPLFLIGIAVIILSLVIRAFR